MSIEEVKGFKTHDGTVHESYEEAVSMKPI